MVDTVAVVNQPNGARSYVEWAPIVAGAMTAAAISFALFVFGSAIGLTAVSPWPGSGLPWWLLMIIAALWFLLVQVGSYAAGGYLAGRLRAPIVDATADEVQFRDGAHGFLVWALGAVVTVLVVGSTAGSILKTGADSAATVATVAASDNEPATLGEAADPWGYALNRMLRPAAGSSVDAQQRNADRDEASLILVASLEDSALPAEDGAYLSELVANRTGIPAAEAQQRVNEAFAALQRAETEARAAVDTARRTSAIGGFLAVAALFISAAAAAIAAVAGGRHRDEGRAVRIFGSSRFW